MIYKRPQVTTLTERLAEPRRHFQMVSGSRQVGKTTPVQQEVDFVVKAGRRLASIEVKSARAPRARRGTAETESSWPSSCLGRCCTGSPDAALQD